MNIIKAMNSVCCSKAGEAGERMIHGPEWVQCVGFRCLAYRDEQGLWHDFHTDEYLAGVIGLVKYNLTELLRA
jgi:hypothetical protein